jgi:hypothetical protein
MAAGSWFRSAEEADHSRVLVVGPTVVSELFGGQDPVGDTVQVDGRGLKDRALGLDQEVAARQRAGRRRVELVEDVGDLGLRAPRAARDLACTTIWLIPP